jgi:hypothetical protein
MQIGLECQLSVEDLAYEVQQIFVVCCRDRDPELPEPEQEPDQPQENHHLMMYSSAMAI